MKRLVFFKRAIFIVFASFSFLADGESIKFSDAPAFEKDSVYEEAREHFRKKDYQKAVFLLERKATLTSTDKWLMAEAYYAMGNFFEAQEKYWDLFNIGLVGKERKKSFLRYLECIIFLEDLTTARKAYLRFQKEYVEVPDKINYAMGQLLLAKKNYKNAVKILKQISTDSDYYVRSLYAQAVIFLKQKAKANAEKKIALFRAVEKSPPVSTEDYLVQAMASLSIARVYASSGLWLKAVNKYAEVNLKIFPKEATLEALSLLLTEADDARLSTGPFKGKVEEDFKKLSEEDAINRAVGFVQRLKNQSASVFQSAEIQNMVSFLYSKAYRFDEGRYSFDRIIQEEEDFLADLKKFQQSTKQKKEPAHPKLFAPFRLEELKSNPLKTSKKSALYTRVFEDYQTQETKVLNYKNRVAKLRSNLLSLKGVNDNKMASMEKSLQKIQKEYLAFAMKVQEQVVSQVKKSSEKSLASIKYQRAQLAQQQLLLAKQKQEYIRNYRSNVNSNINRQIKAITPVNGGAQ